MNWKDEREFDRTLGIDTSLTDTDWSHRRQHPCQPTPLAALEAVAERLKPENHIVDCGCGTGRAVFYLAHAALCRVTGVELDERRYAGTMENLRRCLKKQPATAERVRIIHGAAQECLPEDADCLYFFNPFPAAVLRGVLKGLAHTGGKCIRLYCYYPDDTWTDVLAQSGWTLEETVALQEKLGNDPRERIDIWTMEEWT